MATAAHTVLERGHAVVESELVNVLPADISQNNLITLRDTLPVHSQLAQQQANLLWRQLEITVPPQEKIVDFLCQLTDKEVCGIGLVAEKESSFGYHALRVKESSPGSLLALSQYLFKHGLAQFAAVGDRSEPSASLLTHFWNEAATVNFSVSHCFVMDHAIAQQSRLKALSDDLLF